MVDMVAGGDERDRAGARGAVVEEGSCSRSGRGERKRERKTVMEKARR